MGGNSYPRDVVNSNSSSSFPAGSSGNTVSSAAKSSFTQQRLHSLMNPRNRIVQTNAENLLLLGLDVTGSNMQFIMNVWDKMPMFQDQVSQQGSLPNAFFGFSAVGDAYTDEAPLQVAEFDQGIVLDEWLTRIYPEGHGGGQQMETYELWAYYLARKITMRPKLAFGFLLVDEAPYPTLQKRIVSNVIGDDLEADIDSRVIFTELNRKLNGNLYILQNPYYGVNRGYVQETNDINREWKRILGESGGTIIQLSEEKSMVDVILGVLALKTGVRSLNQYQIDMKNREQTDTRIANVTASLTTASRAIVPVRNVGGNLPAVTDTTKRGSGSQRI